MKITKQQLKQIIAEELAESYRDEAEGWDKKIKDTQGWTDIQPDVSRQELNLDCDFQIDDIASKLELAGFWEAADFLRKMLEEPPE
tara:strand:- start:1451 stop:1708 length:258 start_codon:yes stop_codon:yes gene_type:complete